MNNSVCESEKSYFEYLYERNEKDMNDIVSEKVFLC